MLQTAGPRSSSSCAMSPVRRALWRGCRTTRTLKRDKERQRKKEKKKKEKAVVAVAAANNPVKAKKTMEVAAGQPDQVRSAELV